jgi:hypothetical protein
MERIDAIEPGVTFICDGHMLKARCTLAHKARLALRGLGRHAVMMLMTVRGAWRVQAGL